MRKLILTFALTAAIGVAGAQTFPEPSPRAQTEQRVGLTQMEIEYSRPGVKDRVIFGELVPYGKLWRTGANATTTIRFSEDVTISGNKLKAGEYSIFTIPHEKRIKVIFNSDAEAREGSYDESRNAATIDVPLEDARENVER